MTTRKTFLCRCLAAALIAAAAPMAQAVDAHVDYVWVQTIGAPGTGNGQFEDPWGVAVDPSGNVWVADTYNMRIQEFTSGGAFMQKFGAFGSGNGQFSNPYGLA